MSLTETGGFMFSFTRTSASYPKVRGLTLACSASALALIVAGAAAAQTTPPPAQAPSAPAAQGETGSQPTATGNSQEVIVTGTRIRGVAPVGSALVQVNQQDIKKTGLTSTADILNEVPSVLSLGTGNAWAGGAAQENDGLNALGYNKSPNIRGLGPQATLSLVNGHRMPYEGGNMNSFDGDDYPTEMINRIEIVEDGTSPIYGADAVAGTVNYLLRSPFRGVEASASYGAASGYDQWKFTGLVGDTWDVGGGGGFVLSYEHDENSLLKASARSNLYNDNYTPYGGPPSSDEASPGNIVNPVTGAEFGIPGGQNGQSLTVSQLTNTINRENAWTDLDAIPRMSRDGVALNFNQDLTPWLQIFGDGLYTKRTFDLNIDNGTVNGTQAVVPDSNPFSPCNPARTAGQPAGLVSSVCGPLGFTLVNYSTINDAGPEVRYGYVDTWSIAGGARISLPYDWKATIQAQDGDHFEISNTNFFAAGPPFWVTEGGGFNFFCDGRQFTCNPASLTAPIAGSEFVTRTEYQDQDYTINADGRLFTLPGGDVRLAVGAEYYNGKFINTNEVGGVFSPPVPDGRNFTSGYGELYVPIVGPGNAVPGIQRLEIDIAGRVDSYSDVGSTTNPKIGINWSPTDDLKIHASFGTSFRAPGLANDDPDSEHIYLPASIPGSDITAPCLGCAAATSLTVYQVVGGAAHDLTPEKSTSYSLGGDWTPDAIPGLTVSLNYWWINYRGQIDTPVYNVGAIGAINEQIFNNFIIYNPALFPTLAANNPVGFFGNFPLSGPMAASCSALEKTKITTTALWDQYVGCVNGGADAGVAGPPTAASSLAAVEDGHSLNEGYTHADGLDLSGYYSFRNPWGAWRVGGVAEYIDKWDVSIVPGAPAVNEDNYLGFPLRFKGRAEFSWNRDFDVGNLAAALFVNYENAYNINADQLPSGVSSSYSHIDSYTTVDLTLTYTTPHVSNYWIANDINVTFSVQNLLDTQPPLALNTSAGGGIRFDPANASPLGRMVQIQLSKKF
jgi:iron complex outermembrane recepter protein